MSRIFLMFLFLPAAVAYSQTSGDTSDPLGLNDGVGVWSKFKDEEMMRKHLRTRVHRALDRRLENLERLQTEGQILAYQNRLREVFKENTDLKSFHRTPLNPKVTGVLAREGYTVEKVIFESQPGFYVTGNLYRPEGEGPFPAILHPCGHTANGKAADVYQKANLLFVKNGFLVFCYDPIGQGERKQLLDPKTGKGIHSATGEHHILGVAPVLLGRGLASYMIWDGIRAIDYLESRSDVDSERIGCTGNSGGGNMTSFLMALDDRIAAAAPGCFMTTTRQKNEDPGPGDPEQNIFAQTREGLDHPDLAIIRAPKPTLILAATKDFVPIDGTWKAFRQAKRIYTQLGYPERIDLAEAQEKHGYSRRLREGAVRFFARWLQDRNLETFEPDNVAVEEEQDLLCTPKGQVIAIEGARTMFDLNTEKAEELEMGRKELWPKMNREEKCKIVRQVTGISEVLELPKRKVHFGMGVGAKRSTTISQLEIHATAPGISVLVSRVWTGKRPSSKPHETSEGNSEMMAGYEIFSRHSGRCNLILTDSKLGLFGIPDTKGLQSRNVDLDLPKNGENIYVNLRDSGLTKTKIWRFYGADQWIAYMLGTSYLAMRTEDLIAVTKALRAENGERIIHLHAEPEFVPVAIHAAALEPDLFESVMLHGGIKSWNDVIASHDPLLHLHDVVHGILRHYDLADLLDMIPNVKFIE